MVASYTPLICPAVVPRPVEIEAVQLDPLPVGLLGAATRASAPLSPDVYDASVRRERERG